MKRKWKLLGTGACVLMMMGLEGCTLVGFIAGGISDRAHAYAVDAPPSVAVRAIDAGDSVTCVRADSSRIRGYCIGMVQDETSAAGGPAALRLLIDGKKHDVDTAQVVSMRYSRKPVIGRVIGTMVGLGIDVLLLANMPSPLGGSWSWGNGR